MKYETITQLKSLADRMIAAGFKTDEFEIVRSKKRGLEIFAHITELELIERIPDLLAAGLGATVSEWGHGHHIDIEPFNALTFPVCKPRNVDPYESEYNRKIDNAVAQLKQQYTGSGAPVATTNSEGGKAQMQAAPAFVLATI